MKRFGLSDLSVTMASNAIAEGELCPLEYTDALLDRISEHNGRINAFIGVDAEGARKRARQLRDGRGRSEALGPLFGIPYGVKDNIDVLGLPTTCHSRVMPLLSANENAQVVELLNEAGAICLGKLSLDEFALGTIPANSPWPPTRNPLNLAYTPGSSSSGSAAAVAAGFVPFSLGTDTGGSIRSPAMMTGTVGFKPTNGAVPMNGVFALAPSLDTVGPLTRTVADAAAVMDVLIPELKAERPATQVRNLRIGHIRHFWERDVTPALDIANSLNDFVARLRDAGVHVEDVQLPSLQAYRDVGWTILLYEAHEVHSRELKRNPEAYGENTRRLLEQGSKVSESAYKQALMEVRHLRSAVGDALEKFDALLCAVSAEPACRTDDPQALAALEAGSTRIPFNVTGHPALATPIGRDCLGLPISCQWITHHQTHPSQSAKGAIFRHIAKLTEQDNRQREA